MDGRDRALGRVDTASERPPAGTITRGMDDRARSPLRMLAPVALVVFGIVFLIVLFAAGGGEDDADQVGEGTAQEVGDGSGSGEGSGEKSYTVEAGDTLDSISGKTGVAIEDLQQLNPDLDPQALTAGQKIKLRE